MSRGRVEAELGLAWILTASPGFRSTSVSCDLNMCVHGTDSLTQSRKVEWRSPTFHALWH